MGLVHSWEKAKANFENTTKEKRPGGETGITPALKKYDDCFSKVETAKGVGAKDKPYEAFLLAHTAAATMMDQYSKKLKVVAKRDEKYNNALAEFNKQVDHILYMVNSGRKTLKEKYKFSK